MLKCKKYPLILISFILNIGIFASCGMSSQKTLDPGNSTIKPSTPPPPQASLSVTIAPNNPTTLSSATPNTQYIVKNTSDKSITLNSITPIDVDKVFTTDFSNCIASSMSVLSSGQTCTINIIFTSPKQDSKTHNYTFNLQYNDAAEPASEIPTIIGVDDAPPPPVSPFKITATPTSLNSSSSGSHSIYTITNTSQQDILLNKIIFPNNESDNFKSEYASCNIGSTLKLPAGKPCTINVTFINGTKPDGVVHNYTFNLYYNNDLTHPATGVPTITGTDDSPQPPSPLSAIPSAYSPISGKQFYYTVTNISSAPIQLNSITPKPDMENIFTTDATNCANSSTGVNLTPKGTPTSTCKVLVTFTSPTANGLPHSYHFDINYNNPAVVQSSDKVTGTDDPVPVPTTTFAYIANTGSNVVSQCTVQSDGSLSLCKDSGGTGFNNPVDTILYNINSNTYAYIVNSTNNVSQCTVSNDGSFKNCADSGATNFNCSSGQAGCMGTEIAIANQYAYITSPGNGTVDICPISPYTGSFSNCKSEGGFPTVSGIYINKAYAYIPINMGFSTPHSSVLKCTISSADGSLTACVDSGVNIGGWLQMGSAVAIKNNTAYITGFVGEEQNLSKCDISPTDGSFSNCSGETGVDGVPIGMAINNNYIYIGNLNTSSMEKCTIVADGSANNCTNTGTGFNSPSSIFFVTR